MDAFRDELSGFIQRVEGRAKARIEEAMVQVEEEERKKRLGPGGLDPLEVIETLPPVSWMGLFVGFSGDDHYQICNG